MPTLLHTRKNLAPKNRPVSRSLGQVSREGKETRSREEMRQYLTGAMILAHRIYSGLGKHKGWSFGECLSQGHAFKQGRKDNLDQDVKKLIVLAHHKYGLIQRISILEGWDPKARWKKAFELAWEDLRKELSRRDNPTKTLDRLIRQGQKLRNTKTLPNLNRDEFRVWLRN